MLITVPAMIWSTLWRMPSQASSRPRSARDEHGASDADERRRAAALPVARMTTLPTIAATHAPTSILPSSAMLNIPLRSERMPGHRGHRDRRRELEAAGEDVGHDRRLAGQQVPEERARSTARSTTRSQGRQRNVGAADELERRATSRGRYGRNDPQRADRRRQRGALAALLVDPEREVGRDVEAAAREVEREHAERGEGERRGCARRAALAERRGPRRRPAGGGGRGGHTAPADSDESCRDLGCRLGHVDSPDRSDEAGRRDEHDHQGHDEEEQVERDARTGCPSACRRS